MFSTEAANISFSLIILGWKYGHTKSIKDYNLKNIVPGITSHKLINNFIFTLVRHKCTASLFQNEIKYFSTSKHQFFYVLSFHFNSQVDKMPN